MLLMNKSESKYFNTAVRFNKALLSLLEKKPFEYITVSEICKTAGVNRSTFYLHYETISDLLNETTQYLLNGFLSYFSTDTQSVVLNLNNCVLDELVFICDKYLTPYLNYIKDHKEVFKVVLAQNKLLGFEDVYKRMFENIFNPILARFHYPSDIRQYVMIYYLNGINAIIVEWLKNECDKSTDEISKIIAVCIYGKENVDG